MNTAAKNAGMASAMSSHLTSFREAAIMQPTITSTPAVAADGTAECIRHGTLPVWGVQWHPEAMKTEEMGLLFSAFLKAAAEYQQARR